MITLYLGGSAEDADMCAWNFGSTCTTSNDSTANVKLGKRDCQLQTNWINSGIGKCGL